MMIKVISLDIGGTLIEFNDDTLSKYGFKELSDITNLPYNDVRLAYKDIFQKTKGTRSELINNFCKLLNIKKTIQLENYFKNKFEKKKNIISLDKIDVIKSLKNLGYKIILFSNNCCLLQDYFNDYDGLFDNIFYSFDIGYTKNEKESYKYIEENMGYKPYEFLHIGDTLKSDYIYPKENGWEAIYYGDCDDSEVVNIKSFNEIPKCLTKYLK